MHARAPGALGGDRTLVVVGGEAGDVDSGTSDRRTRAVVGLFKEQLVYVNSWFVSIVC